ncbi:MAG: Na+/H+ antiporter [Alphaproteobacteria bacterium]|nr:Na+/H+ antiporter [Alphaproteobacteria bacterium]MBU1513457.1 Na+/H+ antiporter [Alphaproteobacteria bacterium]MBU2096449.1 Na+/H+ antiporter [Alphaproteobacteria bacterium]MBU2149859.1 Na+/H+ antiporter [Alphaproteobacteria bacterium]MBU2308235.1 Na+/H+ antiporter [Alphaproteobacteria bacterium]
MSSVTNILFLLLAVVVSGALARLTRFPLPLVQIVLGAGIAVSAVPTVELEPDIFFLLFLPPLLFLDGWRIPKDDLLRDRTTVLELAIGLVVLTVVGVGWLIHWMIPSMPLAVAFALAAVVSPTDPIAVSAIAARAPIPKRMMHILEGESLLNDASGLVCMRFAVAAMLTGVFVVQEALFTFAWVALGGLAIGIAVTLVVARGKEWVSRRLGEDTSAQILISLLIPFGAYLAAEHFHCSGILAAVAAGVTMGFTEQSGRALAVTRVRRAAVWDMVQFAANGMIFVLLGEQMPGLWDKAGQTVRATGHAEPWWLAVYVLAISLALGAMRFAWVWTSLRWTLFKAVRRGEPGPKVSWRLVAAMSLAGVRGAITLAGVLTLPLTLTDGTPFPARDLAIFLAAGVILVSLIVASVGLPRVLRGLELPPEPSRQQEIDQARVAAAHVAIRAIETEQHAMGEGQADADVYTEASSRVMELYRQRIDSRAQSLEASEAHSKVDQIERRLRLAGLRAEREEIFRRARGRELDDVLARKLVREIDLLEARYTG